MKILIKSALKRDDFLARETINKNIEIQLLKDFSNSNVTIENCFEEIINSNVNIEAIHYPLYGKEDVRIEVLVDSGHYCILDKVCKLAQKVGNYFNKSILVVIHAGFEFDELIINKPKLNQIDSVISELLLKYNKVDICIENVIPVCTETGLLKTRGGFLWDNSKYVDYFLKNNPSLVGRLGVVFDLCHALTTIQISNFVKLHNLSIEDYFKNIHQNLKLVHLANIGDNGFGEGNHGTAFEHSGDNNLKKFFECYYKYKCSCPITIEVGETDYIVCENYIKTYQSVKKYLD